MKTISNFLHDTLDHDSLYIIRPNGKLSAEIIVFKIANSETAEVDDLAEFYHFIKEDDESLSIHNVMPGKCAVKSSDAKIEFFMIADPQRENTVVVSDYVDFIEGSHATINPFLNTISASTFHEFIGVVLDNLFDQEYRNASTKNIRVVNGNV